DLFGPAIAVYLRTDWATLPKAAHPDVRYPERLDMQRMEVSHSHPYPDGTAEGRVVGVSFSRNPCGGARTCLRHKSWWWKTKALWPRAYKPIWKAWAIPSRSPSPPARK